jgi:hypothetical protein
MEICVPAGPDGAAFDCGWVDGGGVGAVCAGSGCEVTGAWGVAGIAGPASVWVLAPLFVSLAEGGVMEGVPRLVPPPSGVIGCGGGGGTDVLGWPLKGWSL